MSRRLVHVPIAAAALIALVLPPTTVVASEVTTPTSGDGSKLPYGAGAPRTAPTTSAAAPAASVRRLANRPDVRLRQCNADPAFLCGSVPVPIDRTDPAHGTLRIGFMLRPHSDPDSDRRDVVTVAAGGPGAATTEPGYRGFAQFIVGSLVEQRDLLLVDNRGTGRSGVIDCPELQDGVAGTLDVIRSVAACGAQLGDDADRYGSGDVARDIEAVRRALNIPRLDFFVSSYGTVDAQAYAVRYPERVRAVVADSAVSVRFEHGFLNSIDIGPAAARRVGLACRRAPACAEQNARPGRALAVLARTLRRHPVTGWARDVDGVVRRVRVDESRLFVIATASLENAGELAAAAKALRHDDPKPLLRLAVDSPLGFPGGDPPQVFSEGDWAAATCNDLDQAWNRQDPVGVRRAKWQRALAGLPRAGFAPFSKDAVTTAAPPQYCLRWPAPDRFLPAVPRGATAPDVPALLLSGDYDTDVPTSVSLGLRSVFPGAPMVRVAGAGHDATAWSSCARRIAHRFVRALQVEDATACSRRPAYVGPAVPEFPRTAADARPATPLARDDSTVLDHRIATAAVRGVLDAWLQSFRIPGAVATGHGLRGGTFRFDYASFDDHALLRLHGMRFARDVALHGRATWDFSNQITMRLRVRGPADHDGRLRATGTWGSSPYRAFTVRGALGHGRVQVSVPSN